MNVAELRAVVTIDDRQFQATLQADKRALDELGRGAERTSDSVDKLEAARKRLGSLSDWGNRLTVGVTVPLLGLGAGAVKTAVDLEALKAALTTAAGSATEAERQFVRLREVAKLPGLGFREAIQGSVNLQAAGMSALLAERSLKAFGNALASAGKGKAELDGVITALSQIISKGQVSAEEIQQIAERVPQIRSVLKDAFGTADTEAIQKMGLDAEVAVTRIITSLEKLPRFTGSTKSDFENLADEFTDFAVSLGKDLMPVAKDAGKVAHDLMEGWKNLSPEVKSMALETAKWAIVLGPAAKGIGAIRDSWKTLVDLKEVIVGTWVAKTIAIKANSAALDENTAKAIANSGAALGGGPAGMAGAAGRGVLGRALPLLSRAGPVLAGVTAVAGGFWAGTEIEKRLDPWGNHKKERDLAATQDKWGGINAQLKSEIQRRIDAGEAHWEGGRLRPGPGPGGGPALAAPGASNPAELAKARNARYEAELEQARNAVQGSPEERRARTEAARLVPLLEKRRTEIHSEAGKQKQDSEAYWKLVREEHQLTGEIQQLKQAASKEASEAAKKAREQSKATQDAVFAAQKEQAAAFAGDAAEGHSSRAQAYHLVPVLVGRQEELLAQGKALQHGSKEHAEKASEYWQLQTQINQLQRAAIQEAHTAQKKAIADAKANHEASFRAQVEAAKAIGETAQEGQRDQATANALIPVLRAEQERLAAEARKAQPLSREYHELRAEAWKLESQIQNAEQAARKEQKDAAQKALDQAKRARAEQKEILGLRTGLAEAQLKNNPFLNDKQRQMALVPLLVEQFKALQTPVEGETESDRLRRMIEAEGLKGQIVTGALGGRRNPLLQAKLLGELDRMGAQSARAVAPAGRLDPMAQKAAIESRFYPGAAAAGTPVNVNVQGLGMADLFRDPQFVRAFQAFIDAYQREKQNRQGYPLSPGF